MEKFFRGVAARLGELFQPDSLGEAFAVLAANLMVAVAVFVAFYLVRRILNVVLPHRGSRPI